MNPQTRGELNAFTFREVGENNDNLRTTAADLRPIIPIQNSCLTVINKVLLRDESVSMNGKSFIAL